MKLLGNRIIAKPVYLQQYSNNKIIVGNKKEMTRVSKVVSGLDSECAFHKRGYYNEVMINGEKHRIIDKKNILMHGDIKVDETTARISNISDVTVNEDWIACSVIKIDKKIVTVDGKNPTQYQSTRVLAVSDNKKIGVKKGDVLIVRPVAIVTYLDILGDGSPTWFYMKGEKHIFISIGDVIAKEKGKELIPLHEYILIVSDYSYDEYVNKMKNLGLFLPDRKIKTQYGKVIAGGEKIGVNNGDVIIFERQLIVPIDSSLIDKERIGEVIYRVSIRNVIAKVDEINELCESNSQ